MEIADARALYLFRFHATLSLFMNTDPSSAPQSSAVRHALVLAGSTVLFAASCASPNYGTDGNIFAPPRYGYGSPQSGYTGRPAPTADRSGTKPSDGRKTPDIKRDPSDTVVDITPPDARPDSKPVSDTVESTPPPDSTPTTTDTATPSDTTSTVESKPAVTREDLPFGQPVVGKKGFVYSPYAPDKGQVDVDGIPAGTKVKCPYTGKVFRVP